MKKIIILALLILALVVPSSWAADTKGSALSAPAGGAARTDKVYIIDNPGGTPVSTADTIANVFGLLQAGDIPSLDATYATDAELATAAALVDTDDEIIAIINASPSTQIGVPAGGTGAGTFTDGGLLVGAGTGALEALAVGLTTQVLVGGGAGTNPAWGTDLPTAVTIGSGYIYRAGGTDVADADVADDITLTNISQITNRAITSLSATNWRLFYSADGGVPVELALGASGTVLKSNGAAAAPTWEADATGGTTAYDTIGDPTGAGSISFDATETATYDGAWNNEAAITISLNAADLTGDTTGLLITAVDNDDANYIPLLIQDDQDGTPDDLFKVDYQGVATAAGGFVGNVTGNVSGTAATVTGAAQAAITSLGTLTTLTVDDITINGNTISSAGASTLAITPTAGQTITLDGTITVDAGVVAGATSITSTAFVGDLTGNASGSAASITGDLDPDQLSGDTTDDNLVDQDIIEGMATSGVATPGFTAYDSGAPGADKEIGKIYWNDDGTGGDGTEDGDFFIQAMVAGTETDIVSFDNSAATVYISQALSVTGQVVATAGVDLGTSQALVGTTAMTIGGGTQTVAVDSSDWDIDATGVMTGMGNITSNGTIEGATLTEGGQAVYNATETPGGELEGTWATPTLDNTGITLTSITIGALLGVDSIDATGAVPMAYGSADVTSHTFTSDGGATVIDGSTITVPAANNPYIVLDDDDDMDVYIINDDVGAELEFSTDSTVSQNNLATLSEAGTFTTTAGVTVGTFLATTPQSLTVTTEVDVLSLTGSLLLVTGDNDTDNDTVDLQNGTVVGQQLIIVGVALIDADDTITFAMTDTTCTGCQTVLLDEIGDTWTLVWTGSTWATTANSEVP